VTLKNKLVAAILSYPPETMAEAERRADAILAALPQTEVSEALREALYRPLMKILGLQEGDCFARNVSECHLTDDGHCPCTDQLDSLVDAARQALALPVDNISGDSDG
jgi:hypothetical protein